MSEISVIMSVFREKTENLKLSIESVLCQTIKDFEFIIVIDDPDNEELLRTVRDYARNDSRIKLIENTKNIGLPLSLNKAIEHLNLAN